MGMLNPLSYQRLPGPGNWEETRPGCSGCGVFRRRLVVLVMPGEGRHPRRRPVLRARPEVRHGLAVEVRGGRGGHGPRRGAGDGTRPGGQAEGDEDSGEDALGHGGLPCVAGWALAVNLTRSPAPSQEVTLRMRSAIDAASSCANCSVGMSECAGRLLGKSGPG